MILGLSTLTVAIGLLAGRWGQELFATGKLIPDLPVEQIRAGLWTGGLSVVAYGFLAAIKKRPAFLYPALLSATWVYICFLEMGGLSVNLTHAAWIVAVSMAFHYAFLAAGWTDWARCFSLWGQMVFAGLSVVAFVFAPPEGILAAVVAGAAFVPGLFLKREDLTSALIVSGYLTHNLVFRLLHPQFDLALYGLHLIPINCGVLFVRSLLSLRRPDAPIHPFRIAVLFFSAISLGLVVQDPHLAWQAFLAYGILSLLASALFYQGRFLHVGGVLLLIGSEMFLRDQGFQRLELYLLPVAVYLISLGYAKRASRPLRDFLYGVGLVAIYVPASVNAMAASWEWNGVYLGLTSAVLLVFGLHQRSRVLALPSFLVLMANAVIQSRGFFLNVPQWIYLGLGGLTLLGLGGLFEFRRETILKLKDKVTDVWELWD
ncbi:MAG: hypothetical protein IPP35_07600 [Elusimicrobia bacterium]|nr:hypothetical protein [Elusimicrobiota bacterium]